MITFFSDPHIGLNRQAGTTPATRDIIRKNILSSIPEKNNSFLVCAGDLLDKYTNSEPVIKDAWEVYSKLSLCLAGNHDITNTASSVGTLQLLGNLSSEALVINDFGEADIDVRTLDGTKIVSVPHCSTQDLFFDSLIKAEEETGDILLLHCNYDAPEHRGLSDTELNLRKKDADELLKVFKYILIGHEHNAAEHFGGRVKIIGSVFPTSFGDMKNKRILTYENGSFNSVETWNSSKYVELTWPFTLPEELDQDVEFIRITGVRSQADGKDFLAELNKLRKSSNVLAIKDDTAIENAQAAFEGGTSVDLVSSIRKSLANKECELDLFNNLVADIADKE